MDYSNKWLGLAGAGFGVSMIGGVGVYQVNLWNMAGGKVPIRALIVGTRLGVVAHAETGHAVVFLNGVKSADEFDTLFSSGVDWAANLGVKADSFLKTGSKAASGLMALGTNITGWAGHETAKKIVQSLMGDFSISNAQKTFVLLPTPASVGIGAGLWYEWQRFEKVGTDIAWEYLHPKWRIENVGAGYRLRVKDIPEKDGARLNMHVRIKGWGVDDMMLWRPPSSSAKGSLILSGRVHDGRLWDSDATPGHGPDGLDLGRHQPCGRFETGMMFNSRTTDVTRDGWLEIGLSICRGRINLYKWESDGYTSVLAGSGGQIELTTCRGWLS